MPHGRFHPLLFAFLLHAFEVLGVGGGYLWHSWHCRFYHCFEQHIATHAANQSAHCTTRRQIKINPHCNMQKINQRIATHALKYMKGEWLTIGKVPRRYFLVGSTPFSSGPPCCPPKGVIRFGRKSLSGMPVAAAVGGERKKNLLFDGT